MSFILYISPGKKFRFHPQPEWLLETQFWSWQPCLGDASFWLPWGQRPKSLPGLCSHWSSSLLTPWQQPSWPSSILTDISSPLHIFMPAAPALYCDHSPPWSYVSPAPAHLSSLYCSALFSRKPLQFPFPSGPPVLCSPKAYSFLLW